jgi:hypothetical protein
MRKTIISDLVMPLAHASRLTISKISVGILSVVSMKFSFVIVYF